MGRYLNPPNMTKEAWLQANAEYIGSSAPADHQKPDGSVAAVLVDNGWMTAAALAYDQGELQAFSRADDSRPKTWYWVPKELTEEFA